jgi:hypothetical protein
MEYLQGMEKEMKKQFRDFESAREFARELKIVSSRKWIDLSKQSLFPLDIPRYPNDIYKNSGWINWKDWLGYEKIVKRKSHWLKYEDSKKIVTKLGLKNRSEWITYRKINELENIPIYPDQFYKNIGWTTWRNWFGNEWRDFKEARKFVTKLGFKNRDNWFQYCKSGNKPDNIPASPQLVYKKEWKGWGNFLGNGRIANQNKQYLPFKKAKLIVEKLKIKKKDNWFEYCKSGNKPDNIPANPPSVYKKEWEGWGDWLRNEKDIKFVSYDNAKKIVLSLKIKSLREWRKFLKSNQLPTGIPRDPPSVYKKEWEGWGDFLGTGNIQPQQIPYRPFKEAKEFVRTLRIKNLKEWNEYVKSGNKPNDIPAAPWVVYKEWSKK